MSLTGRTRYREKKRLFRRSVLVLQVEYTYTSHQNYQDPYDSLTSTAWRDATFEDITELKK